MYIFVYIRILYSNTLNFKRVIYIVRKLKKIKRKKDLENIERINEEDKTFARIYDSKDAFTFLNTVCNTSFISRHGFHKR